MATDEDRPLTVPRSMCLEVKERCTQALYACRSSNKECLEKTKADLNLFKSDVFTHLNKIEKEILSKAMKQNEENNKKIELLDQKIASHIIHRESDLEKLSQDINIEKYSVTADRNVLDSLKEACKLDVYKTVKVCSLNVAGLYKRLFDKNNMPPLMSLSINTIFCALQKLGLRRKTLNSCLLMDIICIRNTEKKDR